MKRNALGLSITESKGTIDQLNTLLSGFQIYYQNLRGLQWNIRGKRFFELYQKFEELYNDAQLKIDELAERILTLRGRPIHTFEAYLKTSTVTVGKDISKDEQAVSLIVNSWRQLLPLERDILAHTDAVNDEGTNAMMSDFISEQEKTIWMMQAWQDETV